jgi:hypothetical protein
MSVVPLTDGRNPAGAGVKRPIYLFGDSHAHAVQVAITKRKGKGKASRVFAYRLLKEKNGVRIGDTSLDEFVKFIGKLGPDDLVVSMIGGNQHAVYSTIQHPQPFDFFNPEGDPVDLTVAEFIPYNALRDVFSRGLSHGDMKSLEAIRKATLARVVHIIPPPPKQDNEHIMRNHETTFAGELLSRGPSSPWLRLKFWKLQFRILKQICKKLNIAILMPPRRAVNAEGFLRPEFYATDATHGNWLYGERILRQLEKIHPLSAEGQATQ